MSIVQKLKQGIATDAEKNEIAKQYIGVVYYLANGNTDLISAGNEGLNYAILNAFKMREYNLRSWVFLCVSRSMAKERKKKKLDTLPNLYYTPSTLYRDLIELCRDDVERQVVKKRVEGYKDDEIASQIGISTSSVYRVRMGIKQKYEEE